MGTGPTKARMEGALGYGFFSKQAARKMGGKTYKFRRIQRHTNKMQHVGFINTNLKIGK